MNFTSVNDEVAAEGNVDNLNDVAATLQISLNFFTPKKGSFKFFLCWQTKCSLLRHVI